MDRRPSPRLFAVACQSSSNINDRCVVSVCVLLDAAANEAATLSRTEKTLHWVERVNDLQFPGGSCYRVMFVSLAPRAFHPHHELDLPAPDYETEKGYADFNDLTSREEAFRQAAAHNRRQLDDPEPASALFDWGMVIEIGAVAALPRESVTTLTADGVGMEELSIVRPVRLHTRRACAVRPAARGGDGLKKGQT